MVSQELLRQYNPAPPKETGEVQSHYASMEDTFSDIFFGVVFLMAAAAVPVLLVTGVWTISALWQFLLFAALFAWLTGFGIKNLRKACRHVWITVGSKGFVEYRIARSSKTLHSPALYLFEDADYLLFSKTAHYINNSYDNTSFNFELNSEKTGKAIYGCGGTYCNEGEWRIACLTAIELAWSNYCISQKFLTELRETGSVKFKYALSLTIELRTGCLIFKDTMYRKEDIRDFTFKNGRLIIEFVNKPKIDIDINNMHNQKCFLQLLNNMILN